MPGLRIQSGTTERTLNVIQTTAVWRLGPRSSVDATQSGRDVLLSGKVKTWLIQTAVGNLTTNRTNRTIQTGTFLFDKRSPTAPVKPDAL